MLIGEGHLRRENGGWAAAAGDDLGALRIPATVQALLAARIDRLESDERAVLERGALEGNVFHVGTVRALAPDARSSSVPSGRRSPARRPFAFVTF